MARQNTPRGYMSQSKNSGPALGMLPPELKPMFDPRPPLVWKPPTSKRGSPHIGGCAELVKCFETTPPPAVEPYETPKLRHARLRAERKQANEEQIAQALKDWDPNKDALATTDAYKTLFVANMSYDTTEKKLRREFEQFGAIKTVRVVTDKDEQPRGYAFIEFESDEAMRTAYKKADGRKIDGRRLLVDVERGRTVRNWKPRRFGGGLGDSRKDKLPKAEQKERQKEEERKRAEERARDPARSSSTYGGSSAPTPSSYGGSGSNSAYSRGGDDRGRPAADSKYGGGGSRGLPDSDSKYGGGASSKYGGAPDSKFGSGGDPKYGGGGGAADADRRKRSRSRDRVNSSRPAYDDKRPRR